MKLRSPPIAGSAIKGSGCGWAVDSILTNFLRWVVLIVEALEGDQVFLGES